MKNTKYLYRDTVTGRFLSAKKAEKLAPELVVREKVKKRRRSLWMYVCAFIHRLGFVVRVNSSRSVAGRHFRFQLRRKAE